MKLINHSYFNFALYGIFCFLSILFFNPFYTYEKSAFFLFAITEATISVAILFTLIYFSKKASTSLLTYIFISLSCLIAPTIASILILSFAPDEINLTIYISVFLVIGILPASITMLWFVFNRILNQTTIINNVDIKDQTLELLNEQGKVILNVQLLNTICFEANDNYVITYFLDDNDQFKKSMNRISLKKIEVSISSKDGHFHRVHKSYIVNPKYVEQVYGKSQNYSLKVFGMNKNIPVSRGFDISILDLQV